MALYLKDLCDVHEGAYLLDYVGMTYQEEMVAVYRQIAELPCLRFLIADGTQMIYSLDEMHSQMLIGLRLQVLARSDFQIVFLAAPEDHPIRKTIRKIYEEMGYTHKMVFVKNSDEAIEILRRRASDTHST